MCVMGVAFTTPPLVTRGFVCPLITFLAPLEISAIDTGTIATTKNTAWMDQTRDRSALPGRLITLTFQIEDTARKNLTRLKKSIRIIFI